jgi:hypothetical protein
MPAPVRVLTIEPRTGTSLDEKRYYCLAPTDSDTLIALVREFETTVLGAQGRRS